MPNPNYVLTRNLLHALATHGVRHAVITPGSRNTPLALACAMESSVTNWIHHDERSAAFFALGIAKTLRQPTLIVCSSGTAAAEYLPAVTEAHLARVPLIVLTADRPHELRSFSSPQTIDQVGMYGSAAKWFHEAPVPTTDTDLGRYGASLATQAYLHSTEAPAGPVHINMGFRDPLAPDDVDIALVDVAALIQRGPAPVEIDAAQFSGKKTLVIAGPTDTPVDDLPAWCEQAGAVLLADPASSHRGTSASSHGDTLARIGLPILDLEPDVVVLIGAPPTSKALGAFIASHDHIVVVDDAGFRDPQHNAQHVRSTPDTFLEALSGVECNADYRAAWQTASDQITQAWAHIPFPSEPGVAAVLAEALSPDAQLWVASSMPIRDLDSFFHPAIPRQVRSNRGANGIDGFVSSVLGSAAVSPNPTFALTGDLSFLYDISALAAGVRLEIDATFVVVNNDGGGIFSFLPQAQYPEFFESHLATPHGTNIGAVATAYGATHSVVSTAANLQTALGSPPAGVSVIEIVTDRSSNVTVHEDLWRAAAEALTHD